MNRQYGALSGVAIFLIVLNHAIHFGLQITPVNGVSLQGLILLQALGGFAVPTFLFVSGAFLCYAARELSFAFVRSSLARILWPYLIWSVVFYALMLASTGQPQSASAYLKSLLVGYPYHFVPLLVFWYLAAPVVVRIGRRHGAWLLGAVALYQLLLLWLRFPGTFGPPLPAWARLAAPPVLFTPMSDWAIYFPLGLVLSLHNAAVKPKLLQARPVMAVLTGALFAAGILNAYGVMSAPWARFAAPLPLMFLLPAIDRAALPWPRRLEFLGRRSYGIYLAHFAVINLGLLLVVRADVALLRQPLVVFPAFLALALGLSVLLMNVTARLKPTRPLYRYVFGIVPPAA